MGLLDLVFGILLVAFLNKAVRLSYDFSLKITAHIERLEAECRAASQWQMHRLYGCTQAERPLGLEDYTWYRCSGCMGTITTADDLVFILHQVRIQFHAECFVKWYNKHWGDKSACCAAPAERCEEESDDEIQL